MTGSLDLDARLLHIYRHFLKDQMFSSETLVQINVMLDI